MFGFTQHLHTVLRVYVQTMILPGSRLINAYENVPSKYIWELAVSYSIPRQHSRDKLLC